MSCGFKNKPVRNQGTFMDWIVDDRCKPFRNAGFPSLFRWSGSMTKGFLCWDWYRLRNIILQWEVVVIWTWFDFLDLLRQSDFPIDWLGNSTRSSNDLPIQQGKVGYNWYHHSPFHRSTTGYLSGPEHYSHVEEQPKRTPFSQISQWQKKYDDEES